MCAKALTTTASSKGRPATTSSAPLDRNGEIERDFFIHSMTRIAVLFRVPPLNEEEMQLWLDIFRADKWTNSRFENACFNVIRECARFPTYADFYKRREYI